MKNSSSGLTTAGYFHRDFLLGLTGYFFLYLSISLFYIYPLFFRTLHVSQGRIGLIMGITSLTAIAVRPFFGQAIDRRGGRKIGLVGLGLMAISLPLFHLVRDAGLFPL
ncbi:MAG: MFS transporter, partial [Candidatus Aminicenantes bacterium]|nr:MFS transporter [Candidatus Aminicenantes bacterium]